MKYPPVAAALSCYHLSMAAIFDSAGMIEHAFGLRFSFACLDWYAFHSGLRIGTNFAAGGPQGHERVEMPENTSLIVARTRRRI
jgi:hypothetical protein